MNLISKMMTMVRGHATETGQAIVDHQAMTILDQEVRDAQSELEGAKSHLTDVMASHRGAKRTRETLRQKVTELENHAIKAMNLANETLAEEVCAEVERKSQELAAQIQIVEQLEVGMNQIKRDVARTERAITALRNQTSMIKATAKVQAANANAAGHAQNAQGAGSSAATSLARIRARQQEKTDRMQAARELESQSNGGDLDAKLRQAGIIEEPNNAKAVMERLRARTTKAI